MRAYFNPRRQMPFKLHMDADEAAQLLEAVDGFDEVMYPAVEKVRRILGRVFDEYEDGQA